MSQAEEHLQEEVERFNKWRKGGLFHIEAFRDKGTSCVRCRNIPPALFAVSEHKPLSFTEIDFNNPSVPAPTYYRVCRNCLTDSEVAGLLLPALYFVLTILARDWDNPEDRDHDFSRSIHYVKAFIASRKADIALRPDADLKELSLRALEGLKKFPERRIDLERVYTEVQNAIAQNMYLAAHPDDIPQTVEEARGLRERVQIFFRHGASIEVYALRDAARKCIDIFRQYFQER